MASLSSNSDADSLVLSKKELCNILFDFPAKNIHRKIELLEDFLIEKTSCPLENVNVLKNSLSNTFKRSFLLKWKSVDRNKTRLFNNEEAWLQETCSFPVYLKVSSPSERPKSDFNFCSESTKRRKTQDLRRDYSLEELIYATQMALREAGKCNKAEIVKSILDEDFEHKCKTMFSVNPCRLSASRAVSMMVEARLSVRQYNVIRNYSMGIFPSYKEIKQEKSKSYPTNISITENSAEVPLQSLLDHTAKRLVEVEKEVLETLKTSEHNIVLYSKYGFDGSSGHSEYKQRFSHEKHGDKFVFISCVLPLQLSIESTGKQQIVWRNSACSSPRLCRPLRIIFEKESDNLVSSEKAKIEHEISQLLPSAVRIHGDDYLVTHKLIFSMIDGKICNILEEVKSALKCYLCHATSKDFNDIKKVSLNPVQERYLSFGISILHSWIRMFELLLHVAYKLHVKQWRSNKTLEATIEETKNRIQSEFRSRTGLIIDQPKPGFGNSNDGNTARRFFQNEKLSSEITGVDENLIRRFHVILQVLSSGFKINTNKFKHYCFVTAECYVSLYPWYYMSTSVHKILIHGHLIINEAMMPIGMLSEEAQEAKNKEFKFFREHFTRKTSRVDAMTDIFQRMLLSSDPGITLSQKIESFSNRKHFYCEAIEMFDSEITFDIEDA